MVNISMKYEHCQVAPKMKELQPGHLSLLRQTLGLPYEKHLKLKA